MTGYVELPLQENVEPKAVADGNSGPEASTRAMIEGTAKKLEAVRKDAARREATRVGLFEKLAGALKELRKLPLLQHDEHCQNLMARAGRSTNMAEFSQRVMDLQFHIGRLALGKTSSANGNRAGASSINAARFEMPASRGLAATDNAAGRQPGRHRLRL